ncbi:MAG: hypothetical protein ACREFX_11005, partial [Opitutaceae bacterium]
TAVFASIAPDGAESVGLAATAASELWRVGESGMVVLRGPTRPLIVVPTSALILDRGQWWVLVQAGRGTRRQPVVPGPVRGWQTFIENGLNVGDQVLVENAYLEFHLGISRHYQPPD